MTDECFLSTDETAAYLSVCIDTVSRLARAGHIPAARAGDRWRFRERDLLDWLTVHQLCPRHPDGSGEK